MSAGENGFPYRRGLSARRVRAMVSIMTSPDSERFEKLALIHLDSVFRMACRLARDESEAEDLVQETFVRAFRAFPRFELRDHGVKPWLLKILHNCFYTHRGRAKRQPMTLDDVTLEQFGEATNESYPVAMRSVDWDAIDEELKHAVDSLQEEYRVVLLLWSFEELSYKEIAEICECPVGTVMSRLFRARRLLAEKLADFAQRENVPKKA